MNKILEVKNIYKSFGGIDANTNISFEVNAGEILGIIGPNGAGKSTLFDLITGYTKLDKGEVIFNNKIITRQSPHSIARLGIGRTFQKLKPFHDQTLLENVIVGVISTGVSLTNAKNKALEIIDLVDLLEKRNHFAKELSTGQLKRLEMARAMATNPKILMIDEVTGGVDQRTIPSLIEIIKKLNKLGVTIITIEHNMRVIMSLSDRILALDSGQKIAFDIPENIKKNKKVLDAYLGGIESVTT
jgi:branched-chain amino acid transport system ATP-binding protein